MVLRPKADASWPEGSTGISQGAATRGSVRFPVMAPTVTWHGIEYHPAASVRTTVKDWSPMT